MERDQCIKDFDFQSKPIFEPHDLFSKVGCNLPIVKEIVEGFLNDTSRNIQKLRDSLASEDQNAVARLAHTIKGASKYLGATQISEVAFRFEKAAKSGNLNKDHALFEEFEQAYKKLKEAIARFDWKIL